MAKGKSSSGASDFLEILMLTSFMCALFFGAWGGYLHFKKSDLKDQVDFEYANLQNMKKLLSKKENIDTYTSDYRRKESQNGSESFRAAILQVVNDSGKALTMGKVRSTGAPKEKGGMREDKASVDFNKNGKLTDYIRFYGFLKNRKPHIRVESVNLTRSSGRRRGGGAIADVWTNNMSILAYVQVEKKNQKNDKK